MRTRKLRVPIVVALLATLITTLGITAQETDTPLDLTGAIYQGPCDSLNLNPTWPVGDFIEVDEANLIGYTDVGPLLRAEGRIDTTMDDLFRQGGAYSFVVTDNTDPEGDPVACGRLGGVLVNGQVVIGLFTDFLPDPNDTDDADDDDGNLVGVAVFGSTAGEGDRTGQGAITTQQTPTSNVDLPAQLPDQVPVQAYLFVDELDDEDEPEPTATVAPQQQQQAPPPTNTPVPPTATMVPPTATMMPPTATIAPPTATMAPPTATETQVATETEPVTETQVVTEEVENGEGGGG